MGWGEPLVWALATGVAVARTVDERHWASDTFVGSAFGFAAGRLIAQRHLERAERERARTRDADDAGASAVEPRGLRLDGVSAAPIRLGDASAWIVEARVVF
jgi:hypothetical protein